MKTLLLVHDHQEDPWARKQSLESVGFRVELARSGPEALACLEKSLPDLVLMDVLLEGSHGFDVCRAVRRQVPAGRLPVILASHVYTGPRFEEEALAAGAQAYLAKPCPLHRLVAEVMRVLGRPQAAVRDLASVPA